VSLFSSGVLAVLPIASFRHFEVQTPNQELYIKIKKCNSKFSASIGLGVVKQPLLMREGEINPKKTSKNKNKTP